MAFHTVEMIVDSISVKVDQTAETGSQSFTVNFPASALKHLKDFKGYANMENDSIQELFDQYEEKSIVVEQAKAKLDQAQLPDLSKEEYISAMQADEHIIACIEREKLEEHLETLGHEWTTIQDRLAEKLCRINTKVMVKDKRDNCDVLIYCEGGAIMIEDIKR